MSDAPFSPRPEEEPDRLPWVAMLSAALVLVGIVVGLVFYTRTPPAAPAAEPPAYAQKLKLSDQKMSAAENFVGSTVSYAEGRVTNAGDKTVMGADIEVTFKNSLGEVVQQETIPLMVIHTRQPYVDTAPLRMVPLKPGETREFRLTFEHISRDWNQQYPDMKVVAVTTD